MACAKYHVLSNRMGGVDAEIDGDAVLWNIHPA